MHSLKWHLFLLLFDNQLTLAVVILQDMDFNFQSSNHIYWPKTNCITFKLLPTSRFSFEGIHPAWSIWGFCECKRTKKNPNQYNPTANLVFRLKCQNGKQLFLKVVCFTASTLVVLFFYLHTHTHTISALNALARQISWHSNKTIASGNWDYH